MLLFLQYFLCVSNFKTAPWVHTLMLQSTFHINAHTFVNIIIPALQKTNSKPLIFTCKQYIKIIP